MKGRNKEIKKMAASEKNLAKFITVHCTEKASKSYYISSNLHMWIMS